MKVWKLFSIMFLLSVFSYALEGGSVVFAEEDFLKDLSGLRDPFVSQAPKKAIIVEPVVVPVKPVVVQPTPVKTEPPKKIVKPVLPPVKLPIVKERPVKPNYRLNGVVWGTEMPQAIINDTVFKIGDSVGAGKVTNIRRDGVEISQDGLKYFLSVDGQISDVNTQP